MKLIRNWTDFTRQLDDFVNQGTEIHSKEREVLTQQDFLQSKNNIEELIKSCRNFLKESFEEDKLNVLGGKFQDASIFYNSMDEINSTDLKHWLKKAREIQWDYKNIVKRKGVLERLK